MFSGHGLKRLGSIRDSTVPNLSYCEIPRVASGQYLRLCHMHPPRQEFILMRDDTNYMHWISILSFFFYYSSIGV